MQYSLSNCSLQKQCQCYRDTKIFFSPVCDLQFGNRKACLRLDCTKKHSDNPAQLIRNAILNSKLRIDVCMYRFSNKLLITQDLIRARKKGIIVRVLADIAKGRATANGEADTLNHFICLDDLRDHDIQVKGLKFNGIMHHKFGIFDESLVIDGSMNWTWSGIHKNCETTFQSANKFAVDKFVTGFRKLWQNSELLTGLKDRQTTRTTLDYVIVND